MGKNTPSWEADLPDEKLDVYAPNLRLFFQTMYERQEVWYKRFFLGLERPWTEDEFLNNNKFTNVYRELDRNSQWQINNILLDENASVGKIDLLWKMMFFRFLNNPDFFEWLRNSDKSWNGLIPKRLEYNAEEFHQLMQDYRAQGGNPFTNAYLINSQACPGKKRDWCYAFKVLEHLRDNVGKLYVRMKRADDPKDIIDYLKTWPAVADFIAHEFYQDFTYFPRYRNLNYMKFDQDDFTNVGPGASIGIRLIFPNLKGREQIEGIYMLKDLAEEQLNEFGTFKYLNWDKDAKTYSVSSKANITLHQIEMWLCEFQKYWKMTIGKGKQRSVFTPKTKKLKTIQ